ncbi:hypothetical protein UF75_2173 [Desulfosporosinus sp. I2]|nr:hypothetical protein UF75_2173 [Desulfosporosinus sp. I2]
MQRQTLRQQVLQHSFLQKLRGSRGLSGFKEFLGSVNHTVVQQSLVPVLLIK